MTQESHPQLSYSGPLSAYDNVTHGTKLLPYLFRTYDTALMMAMHHKVDHPDLEPWRSMREAIVRGADVTVVSDLMQLRADHAMRAWWMRGNRLREELRLGRSHERAIEGDSGVVFTTQSMWSGPSGLIRQFIPQIGPSHTKLGYFGNPRGASANSAYLSTDNNVEEYDYNVPGRGVALHTSDPRATHMVREIIQQRIQTGTMPDIIDNFGHVGAVFYSNYGWPIEPPMLQDLANLIADRNTKQVRITTPFFPDGVIGSACELAIERGVDVKLLTRKHGMSFPFGLMQTMAERAHPALDRVTERTDYPVHMKMAQIKKGGQTWTYVGSHNLNRATNSVAKAAEAGIIIHPHRELNALQESLGIYQDSVWANALER